MAARSLSDEALLAFFQSHPNVRDRLASIDGAVENASGDLGETDAAEDRLIDEMQLLGREALQSWADKRVEATERDMRGHPGLPGNGKETPLAYEVRRNSCPGAGIQAQDQPRAPLCPGREGQSARMVRGPCSTRSWISRRMLALLISS